MQSKLATWSTENKERKFDRLLRLVADRVWLGEAARITLASSGAKTPGVDGIGKTQMEENLHAELAAIRTELLAGSYRPLPARRVLIPKANGKMRPLGIPCLRDRIVQRAILMVMEPIWESDFHPASYGFRPARSVHHAIRTVKLQLQDGGAESTAGRWVIEGDLASYFDTVHHRLLMKGIRKRIADQRLLELLWKFIKAGCVDHGLFRAASEGVPQGGVISPLLSNIMLHEFDAWMEMKYLNKRCAKTDGRGTSASSIGGPLPCGRTGGGYLQYRTAVTLMTLWWSSKGPKCTRKQCGKHAENSLKANSN